MRGPSPRSLPAPDVFGSNSFGVQQFSSTTTVSATFDTDTMTTRTWPRARPAQTNYPRRVRTAARLNGAEPRKHS